MVINSFEYTRFYNINHKEKINQMMKTKIPCEYCGTIVSRCHMWRHNTTKKCQLKSGLKINELQIL